MYRIIAYIKFLFSATNQHGVHSPFVFKFITQCLYNKTTDDAYTSIKDYRKTLIRNKDILEVTDFGSGSRVFKSSRRRIDQIAKTSGQPLKLAQLLFRISAYFNPKSLLELGTSLGIATFAMAVKRPDSSIISIEGSAEVAELARKQLTAFGITNVDIRTGTFEDELSKLETEIFDLVFFDGHHDKNATIAYFESLLKRAHNDSVFIFDDIYWSKGMTEAWEEIKSNHRVTATVDCFYFGIAFFKRELSKEHFKIRL